MRRVTMNIGTHGVETTASEMRKRLAQALSKIPGDQKVFFNLTVHLENYSPAPKYSTYIVGANDFTPTVQATSSTDTEMTTNVMPSMSYGELARPENE